MYEIMVKGHFSAAHSLKEIGGECEGLHGHNFIVEASVSSPTLLPTGVVIDFRVLKKNLGDIIDTLDHVNLNELAPFTKVNPSSENLAKYIHGELKRRLSALHFTGKLRVSVWESENSRATYFEG